MKEKAARILDILIESVNYIVINFALASMLISFNASWVFILFFASDVWITYKYWEAMNRLTGKKGLTALVWICSVIVLIAVVYFVGYVSGTLVRFSA